MKKVLLTLAALLTLTTSCDNGNNETSIETITLDFEALDSAIDNSQYGGTLLYGGNGYEWYDSATDLYASLPDYWQDGTFFGGGIAISNYVDTTITATYEQQLTLSCQPKSGSNFAVCYIMANECPPTIKFKGEENIVEELYICATAYTDEIVRNGNAFSAAMADNGYIRIEAQGIDSNGTKTGKAEFYLYDGREFKGWQKWNLSALGAVKCIEFRMFEGTTEGKKRIDSKAEYPNFPTYFAIDDIAVRK